MPRLVKTIWSGGIGRISAFILASVLIIAPAVQASQQRPLVLELNGQNKPLTEVSVNGVQTSALIDTGATIALINDHLIPSLPDTLLPSQHLEILGIGGARNYPAIELSTLSVGNASWRDLPVALNTLDRFPVEDSVLPISLFQQTIVDFDFRNDQILLYDGRPKRVRRSRTSSVRYHDQHRLIFIDVKINGARGKALIDTGADVSFVNQAFAEQSGAKLLTEDTKLIRGSDLNKHIASMYAFRDFEFANNRVARPKFPVLETDLFDRLGFPEQPMMIIGMDILQYCRMQVDRKRRRVTFIVPEREPTKRVAERREPSLPPIQLDRFQN